MSFALLSWLIVLPFFAAIALLGIELVIRGLWNRALPASAWWITGLLASVGNATLATLLWLRFEPAEVRFQFVEHATWLPQFHANYLVGVDGIALALVMLCTLLPPFVWLGLRREIIDTGKFYAFSLLTLQTTVIGALLSLNLLVFYAFWELSIVPLAFLVAAGRRATPREAVLPFVGTALLGSFALLFAILVLSTLRSDPALELSGRALDFIVPVDAPGGALRDLRVPLWGETLWWRTQPVLFSAFALAFATRMGLFPFHTWLSASSVVAPRGGSILVLAMVLPSGAYGFFRFALPLFPDVALGWSTALVVLATFGLIFGGLIAWAHDDLQRATATACFASLHVAIIGFFSLTGEGFEGGALFLVTHGFFAGGLLVMVSRLLARRNDARLQAWGGLAGVAPVAAGFFGVFLLAGGGMPGFGAFVSNFLVLLGSYRVHPTLSVIATLGVLLIAAVLLRLLWRVAFGPKAPGETPELRYSERLLLCALLLPSLWVGLYPETVLRRLHPSVLELCAVIEKKASAEALRDHGWTGCH